MLLMNASVSTRRSFVVGLMCCFLVIAACLFGRALLDEAASSRKLDRPSPGSSTTSGWLVDQAKGDDGSTSSFEAACDGGMWQDLRLLLSFFLGFVFTHYMSKAQYGGAQGATMTAEQLDRKFKLYCYAM